VYVKAAVAAGLSLLLVCLSLFPSTKRGKTAEKGLLEEREEDFLILPYPLSLLPRSFSLAAINISWGRKREGEIYVKT
jgi:hypothetical protein